jgi:hypothetical protein
MSKFTTKLFIIFFAILFSSGNVFADKVCLKSSIRKGKIRHSTKVVTSGARCPSGFSSILDSKSPATAALLTGPQGPQGVQGPQGIQGPQGAAGPEITLAFGTSASDSTSPKHANATCPSGKVVIGGYGGAIEGLGIPTSQKIAISYASVPPFVSNYFRVDGFEAEATSASWQIVAVAMCVPQS